MTKTFLGIAITARRFQDLPENNSLGEVLTTATDDYAVCNFCWLIDFDRSDMSVNKVSMCKNFTVEFSIF